MRWLYFTLFKRGRSLAEEKTLSSKYLYKGKILNWRIDTVQSPDGREATREIVEHQDVICVVPVNASGEILLIRQYRQAIKKELLEIPAGGIEPGESPDEAVRREMQEETGYFPGKLERMGGFYSSPGFCSEYLYLYLATDLKPSRLMAEDSEGIEVVPVKPRQIKQLIRSAAICDSKSQAGLLYYLELYKKTSAK